MFRRRWLWFGKLVSDEGYSLAYGNKSVTYGDGRGSFQFGFEDGRLFPTPKQLSGKPVSLDELNAIIERVLRGIRSEGHAADVYSV
jgi:hypothetical protein